MLGKLKSKFIEFLGNEDGFLPIIALAATIIGTSLQTFSAIKQTNAAKDAQKAQRGAEELAAQRERLRTVREARIRRAELAAAADAQGVGGSSGELGATASIGTQLQANLGFIASQQKAANDISSATLRSNKAQLLGSFGGSISSIGAAGLNFSQRQDANKARQTPATRVNITGP